MLEREREIDRVRKRDRRWKGQQYLWEIVRVERLKFKLRIIWMLNGERSKQWRWWEWEPREETFIGRETQDLDDSSNPHDDE